MWHSEYEYLISIKIVYWKKLPKYVIGKNEKILIKLFDEI